MFKRFKRFKIRYPEFVQRVASGELTAKNLSQKQAQSMLDVQEFNERLKIRRRIAKAIKHDHNKKVKAIRKAKEEGLI